MLLINNNNSIDALEILLQAGLSWGVTKEPLFTESGLPTTDEKGENGYIATVRSDNNAILGVRKAGYEIFTNQQLAELIIEFSGKAGLPIHSAGALQGGAKVYIQLKTENLLLGTDRIEGFATAINSFDGSTALAIGHSTKTISCQNTFFGAYREVNSKIKHTKGMIFKVDDLLRSLDAFRNDEQNNFATIRKLASAPITDEMKEKVYLTMFKASLSDVNNPNSDAISTRNRNNINRFQQDLHTELQDKGATLWGLFSGLTRYTTYQEGDSKLASKMFGSTASSERLLFNAFAKAVN